MKSSQSWRNFALSVFVSTAAALSIVVVGLAVMTLMGLGIVPSPCPQRPTHAECSNVQQQQAREHVVFVALPSPDEKEPMPKRDDPRKDIKLGPNVSAKIKKDRTFKRSNTPYDDSSLFGDLPDPPPVDELPGDPFGDPNGWSDLTKDGDPWATSVMTELNKMQYPSYAAQVKKGTLVFRMRICKDGKIDQVTKKTSTGDTSLDNLMLSKIKNVKLPRPPTKIVQNMKANCVSLKYDFRWMASGKVG